MSYQGKPPNTLDNPNPELSRPDPPVVQQTYAPQVTGAAGGAPVIGRNGDPRVSQIRYKSPVPSPWSLKDIQATHQQMIDKLRESMMARYNSLTPEQQNSRFWQGFKQYPAEMSALAVRRVLTNQLSSSVSQTPVGQWMSWLKG